MSTSLPPRCADQAHQVLEPLVEDPQQRLPEAYVRILRYRGTDRGVGAGQQLLQDQRCEVKDRSPR